MDNILGETPDDVIALILDITIGLKTNDFNFDDLLALLKKWHNKKLARELILSLCYKTYILEDKDQIAKCPYFIIELIKIDEIGLAHEFLNLMKRTNEILEQNMVKGHYSTDSSDDSEEDNRAAWANYEDPVNLNRDLSETIMKAFKDDENFVEVFFKIGVKPSHIYDYKPYKYEELFIKAAIKFESVDYFRCFFAYYDNYNYREYALYLKYKDIARKIVDSERMPDWYYEGGYDKK
jgi:hypothetical protein